MSIASLYKAYNINILFGKCGSQCRFPPPHTQKKIPMIPAPILLFSHHSTRSLHTFEFDSDRTCKGKPQCIIVVIPQWVLVLGGGGGGGGGYICGEAEILS